MRKRYFVIIAAIMVLTIISCVKETYNMKLLSKQSHLSPTLAISAVKGNILFSDMVKSNDTIVFDQNKFVLLVIKKDSIVDLQLTDFSKGILIQRTATIIPTTLNLDISDVLNHITGDILIASPSIKFDYTNSFADSISVNLVASGYRGIDKIDLNLAPFVLTRPNLPAQQEVTASYVIDKTNSNLPQLVSLPPDKVIFSGTVTMSTSVKSAEPVNLALGANRLLGSLELTIPLELKMNNLQFSDTVDNFLKSDSSKNDDPFAPDNFQLLKVTLNAKNGFPLGATLKMSLYDSTSNTIKSTVNAADIIKPAPVDSNGKVSGVTESTTTIEFTRDFFSNVNKADKVIFWFTLNTTGNTSQNVKIYSDYRIEFTASLVLKPDINLK